MDKASIKVLVVDDMLTMRKIVSKACKDAGFKDVVEASDGQVAWTKITEEKPMIGLIVSDWNMPNATGLDLLKRVRADSRFKHIPFMLVTAESEASQVAEAMRAGVDNYIIKPFEKDVFSNKIDETLNKAKTRNAA